MRNTSKIIRSPLFIAFLFVSILTIVSYLILHEPEKTNSHNKIPTQIDMCDTSRSSEWVTIAINEQNLIFLNGEEVHITNLRKELNQFISKENVAFKIKNSEMGSYATYVEVYDAIKDVIKEARERLSSLQFDKGYSGLTMEEKTFIDQSYPLKISEVFLVRSEGQ